MDLIWPIITDIQPGRLIESLIFLAVLLWKVKPHLKLIEDRMMGMEDGLKGLEKSMTNSFKTGETRFSSLEHRMELLDDRISDCEDITDPLRK